MQINKFWSLGLVALALAGCSKDGKGPGTDQVETRYLAVAIKANTATTRAPGDQMTGQNPDSTSTYEEGLAAENAVNKVRFYFFDENTSGEFVAAPVKTDNTNYYDWTPSEAGVDMPNVEKALVATIVLQHVGSNTYDKISKTDYPDQIVAILNPDMVNRDNGGLPATSLDLEDLRSYVEDYTKTTSLDNGFVMANSVYVSGTPGTADAVRIASTKIERTNVATDPAAALSSPVVIYVERCVAKVRMNWPVTAIQPTTDTNDPVIIDIKDENNANIYAYITDAEGNKTADSTKVQLRIDGWNLTATTEKSYLSKHEYASWSVKLFGDNVAWNFSDFFRSYWALNPENAGQQYFKYSEIGGNKNFLYTNENAGSNTTGDATNAKQRKYPTQVIIAATLIDEDGNELEVCEYAGKKFIGSDALILQMVNFASLYKMTTETVGGVETTTYTKITKDDVKLVTALANGTAQTGQDHKGRYYVELALADKYTDPNNADYEEVEWAESNIEHSPAITLAKVKSNLKAIGHAKVWAEGMTYYYFPIKHLGGPNHAGEYGVVRNHIYECNIKSITGLGTPVYDPNETVWPEKPTDDDDTYISAQINILSWRVVLNDVDLTSKE